MSSIKEYAEEIPREIRRAVKGFDNDIRAAIFVALLKHGELSFSDLREKLNIDKAKLNYHLNELTKSALVKHYYRHELGKVEFSLYSISVFGNNFLDALVSSLKPEPVGISFDRRTPTTLETYERIDDMYKVFRDFLRPGPWFVLPKVDTNECWVNVPTGQARSLRESLIPRNIPPEFVMTESS